MHSYPDREGSYRLAVGDLEARGFGIKPGLERMEALTSLLDNPQLTYPTIHIAGTNGKSSTARMIGAILAAHGLKTGVYTSPHLQTLRERFLLLGPDGDGIAQSLISEREFAQIQAYLRPFVELIENERDEAVTYFELATLMAFEWMAERSVAVGVFEAGMGGGWDATNLVASRVAVLTRVAVDHQEFLGSTPVQNAAEKVQIIKPGSIVVSEQQDPAVTEMIESKVKEQDGLLALAGRDFSVTQDQTSLAGRLLQIQGRFGQYKDLMLPLHGAHQSANLALSVIAVESFIGRALNEDSLRAALASVRLPGRLEVLRLKPLVVLDGAHNPDGAAALAAALKQMSRVAAAGAAESPSITMVIAVFKDKDVQGILEHLTPHADRIFFTNISNERSADPESLATIAAGLGKPSRVISGLTEAVDTAISAAGEQDIVVITGSLSAVGEARTHLEGG